MSAERGGRRDGSASRSLEDEFLVVSFAGETRLRDLTWEGGRTGGDVDGVAGEAGALPD